MTLKRSPSAGGRMARLRDAAVTTILCLCAAPPAGHAADAVGHEVLDTPSIMVRDPTHVLLTTLSRSGAQLMAGGEHGVILVSSDDGQSWRQAVVPINATITRIVQLDERHAWAVGHFGTALRSDDGGAHWRMMLDGITAARIGRQSAEALPQTDPDRTRRLHLATRFVAEGPDKPLLLIRARDDDHLQVFGGYNLALETNDGGTTWSDIGGTIRNPLTLNLYGWVPRADGILLVGEQGLLVGGEPGHQTQKLPSPYDGSFMGATRLPDGRTLVFGLVGHAFLSAPGSDAWTPVGNAAQTTLAAATVEPDGAVDVADVQGNLLRLDTSHDQAPVLNPTGRHAPWPVIDMISTQSHGLLLAGAGGLLHMPSGAATAPGGS